MTRFWLVRSRLQMTVHSGADDDLSGCRPLFVAQESLRWPSHRLVQSCLNADHWAAIPIFHEATTDTTDERGVILRRLAKKTTEMIGNYKNFNT